MKNLIVTSDDCGLSEGINLATAELHKRGLITTASVMTNFEASSHALALFARYPALDTGVHLNLTDGFALTNSGESSSLTGENGAFRGKQTLFSNALAARSSFLNAVRQEMAAQIDVFIDSGLKPRHLTTHIHFQCFPSLRSIVCELAHDYGVEWIRNSSLRRAVVPFNALISSPKEAPEPTRRCHFVAPDYLVGLQFWMRFSSHEALFERLLHLDGTLELIVHPSLEQDSTYPDGVAYQPLSRYYEMQYFERFFMLLGDQARGDFRFTTMREIG